MVLMATFSARSGCGACRLRFPRQPTCPSCGGSVFDLADRRARAAFGKAARRSGPRTGAVPLVRLAAWEPRRPWLVALVGALMAAPALLSLAFDRTFLLQAWWADDATGIHIEHEGLSRTGLEILGIGAFGLALLVFTALASYAARRVEERAAERPAIRVHGADAPLPEEHVRLEGIARLSTVTTNAPLSGAACLVVGLRGRVGDMDVADADGGDFDLELDSGERVALSLEHAVLVAEDGADTTRADAGADADAVAAFLEERGVTLRDEPVALEEARVHDGDRVVVEGRVLGGKLVAFRPGTASGRVVAGDARALLRIRIGAEIRS